MVVEEEREIHGLVTNFYKNLFSSCAGTRFDELLAKVQPKVTVMMNQFLLREITNEEVKLALDGMGI